MKIIIKILNIKIIAIEKKGLFLFYFFFNILNYIIKKKMFLVEANRHEKKCLVQVHHTKNINTTNMIEGVN